MPSRIALQMYTLREFCKTPTDLAATLRRVKQIGYDAVQLSGHGPIDHGELVRIVNGEGLACCATHVPIDRLENESARVIDEHAALGCRYTAIGGFFNKPYSAENWSGFIDRYNAIAKKYAGPALSIGYHNHSHELMRFAEFGGATVLQTLLDRLDRSIWMEIDTYWVQHGGGDPAEWIRKVARRIPCVHLKDMVVTGTTESKPVMAEVGEGNLNWPAIRAACKSSGVEWYIIEQDTCQRDPFESVAISLRNAKSMGLE
jgi:sugar phosphate isomerase/epimerase